MPPSNLPHSWSIETWPPHVWPHQPSRARWLLRAHRDELQKAGCLSRVGREIVVHGARFDKWLQRQAAAVEDYQFPGKSEEAAA